jgi:membrane dipeptidase
MSGCSGIWHASRMASHLDRASALLEQVPLIDGHNDLAWALRERFRSDPESASLSVAAPGLQTDLPRLRRGRIGAQFWSVYVPGTFAGEAAVTATLEQIDLVRRIIDCHPDELEFALTADDVERIFASGKVASLLGAEGGHSIASSLGVLRALFSLGVRYLTLTHNHNVPWADAATDEPACGGLTPFGAEVVHEMQRLGMLVDLSHVSADAARATLRIAEAPVIFSHSSARALCDHPRNVPDDVLAELARNNGICMVTFVPEFVSPACRARDLELAAEMTRQGADYKDLSARVRVRDELTARGPAPAATLAQVADHIEHIRAVAGVDHVGIGGDYDGTEQQPAGLRDVSCYPALLAELMDRGWTDHDCALLAGGNVLRVLREAESVARKLSELRGPATALIEELDVPGRNLVGSNAFAASALSLALNRNIRAGQWLG